MDLYFTQEEMTEFLRKLGYKVQSVETWENQNIYHNKVETVKRSCIVAYLETDKNDFRTYEHNYIKSNFGFDRIFQKELKKKILDL